MKVIELLNKIANGEEVPRKIKYDDNIFDLFISSFNKVYYNDEYLHDFFTSYDVSRMLNDEVEIIEEDEKIKKVSECFTSTDNKEIQFLIDNINQLGNKINEIIDKVNSMEEK